MSKETDFSFYNTVYEAMKASPNRISQFKISQLRSLSMFSLMVNDDLKWLEKSKHLVKANIDRKLYARKYIVVDRNRPIRNTST